MLPYKPWDAPSSMSPNETAVCLAYIIENTGVDGFFLDTMFNIPNNFRTQADKVKKAVFFAPSFHQKAEEL